MGKMAGIGKEIPVELRGKLSLLDKSLTDIESKFEPLLNVSQIELNAQVSCPDITTKTPVN